MSVRIFTADSSFDRRGRLRCYEFRHGLSAMGVCVALSRRCLCAQQHSFALYQHELMAVQ